MTTTRQNRIIASPRARRALKRTSVDGATLDGATLDGATLRGSGPNGRILERDVVAHEVHAPTVAPTVAPTARIASPDIVRAEIDASRLVQLHEQFAAYAQKQGASFSLSDLFLHSFAHALRLCKELSAETDVAFNSHNNEQAFLRNAARLNLFAIAKQRAEIGAESTVEIRVPALRADTPRVALFNAGAGRIDEWTPALPANYVLALGVGSIARRMFAVGEEAQIRPTLRLCLAFESDKIARASAAAFFHSLIELLEQPEAMLFHDG